MLPTQRLRLSSDGSYATAIAAVYDPRTRMLTFASAGHPGPIRRTSDGLLMEFTSSGSMLGLRSGEEHETCAITMSPDSRLVFYTDGLVEIVRDPEEGFRRLEHALKSGACVNTKKPAEAIVCAVLGSDKARDDIAVLVVTFT